MPSAPVIVFGDSGLLVHKLADRLAQQQISHCVVPSGTDAPGVAHLSRLFSGSRVVINTHGPFATSGHDVAEAALAAGCHYLDASDERDWLVKARESWHQPYADHGLLMVPGLAQPFTKSEIATNISLETPGAEALDILMLWSDLSTDCSTQRLNRVAKNNGFDVKDPGAWPLDRTLNVRLPGRREPGMAMRCDSSPHEIWFEDDPRVSEMRAYGGATERSALERAFAQALADDATEGRSPLVFGRRMDASIDSVYSQGSGRRTHVVLEGSCPYDETTVLHAAAATALLAGPPKRTGFASGCQAFGHRVLLDALVSSGLVQTPRVTVDA